MTKILLSAVIVLLAACSKDDTKEENIVFIKEPAGGFVIDKMTWLRIQPEIKVTDGQLFGWSLNGMEIADTKDLLWVFAEAGVYRLTFKTKERSQTVAVTVNEKMYSNGITKVFAYNPAPGQFINMLPAATAADTPETMRQKAENALKSNSMITLGGFGGYVVFGFDHTVVNKAGKDFTVLGNANNNGAEPGVMLVSYDANGNGLPDDEWFEIAGSEYHKPTTIRNYEITYYKPALEPADPNERDYIRWTDNQGQSGYLTKNEYHTQSYYPLWTGDSYTVKGTLMAATINNNAGSGTVWISTPYEWGYADNYPNNNEKAQIDLDWAVDKDGNAVRLTGIDFVKVHTGNRAEGGRLGEVSTEVSGFTDLNLLTNK